MEPRLLLKPALTIIGLADNGAQTDPAYEHLWAQLTQRYIEIPQADPDAGYGLHTFAGGTHQYLAGLSVLGNGPVPPGMTRRQINPHLYAVFTHTGPIINLQLTMDRILNDWLPASDYHFRGDYYFEYYDDHFHPEGDDSLFFIYLPIHL